MDSVPFAVANGRYSTHIAYCEVEQWPFATANGTDMEYKYYAPDIGLLQDGQLKLVKYGPK
ncbi:MAG TPA: hypothetical protein VLA93_06500 [Pyrinomonadaceae bacterium]|nr:hypothetical protein [Pyrinomonadaceae bacterium]